MLHETEHLHKITDTEPWWRDYATSRPFQSHYYYLRRTYFSPVNDSYLWSVHPFRPYSKLCLQCCLCVIEGLVFLCCKIKMLKYKSMSERVNNA